MAAQPLRLHCLSSQVMQFTFEKKSKKEKEKKKVEFELSEGVCQEDGETGRR